MDWWHTPINSPYYFLVFGAIFVFSGCGFDVHRKNLWTVRYWDVSRQRADSVLVGSRNILHRWCLLHRIFLVQGDLNPLPPKWSID